MRSKQFIFENPIFMEHKCRRSSLDGTPSLAKHLATDIKVREIHNRSINKLNIKKKKPIVLKIGSDRLVRLVQSPVDHGFCLVQLIRLKLD